VLLPGFIELPILLLLLLLLLVVVGRRRWCPWQRLRRPIPLGSWRPEQVEYRNRVSGCCRSRAQALTLIHTHQDGGVDALPAWMPRGSLRER